MELKKTFNLFESFSVDHNIFLILVFWYLDSEIYGTSLEGHLSQEFSLSPCWFTQPQAARGRGETSSPSGECLEILQMSQNFVMILWAIPQACGAWKN